jgi:hypothetical protein
VQGGKLASTLLANYFTSLINESQPERWKFLLEKQAAPEKHARWCAGAALFARRSCCWGITAKRVGKYIRDEADFYYFPPSTLLSAHSRRALALPCDETKGRMRNDNVREKF